MGYVKKPDVVNLVWDADTEHPGLQVRALAPSTGEYLMVVRMTRAERLSPDDLDELYGTFAPKLIEWNLQVPDGDGVKDVPVTLAGLLSQDFDFISKIIVRWALATSNVEEELGKELPSGEQFPEESIPMDALSDSLQSLNTPN